MIVKIVPQQQIEQHSLQEWSSQRGHLPTRNLPFPPPSYLAFIIVMQGGSPQPGVQETTMMQRGRVATAPNPPPPPPGYIPAHSNKAPHQLVDTGVIVVALCTQWVQGPTVVSNEFLHQLVTAEPGLRGKSKTIKHSGDKPTPKSFQINHTQVGERPWNLLQEVRPKHKIWCHNCLTNKVECQIDWTALFET